MDRPLTKEQLKTIERRAERARARRGDEDAAPLPLFIRIGESDLYDWDIMTRAVFKEVAYMQAREELPEQDRPPYSPFTTYKGWCYAKQRYLAERVGTHEDTAQKALDRMERDGVLKVRRYKDKYGRKHCEYQIIESVVDAHQRTGARKPAGRKAPKTAFKSADKSSDKFVGASDHTVTDRETSDNGSVDHPVIDREIIRQRIGIPTDPQSEKNGLQFVSEFGVKERQQSTPPTASPSGDVVVATLLQKQEQRQNQPRQGLVAKQEQKQPQPRDREALCEGHKVAMQCDRDQRALWAAIDRCPKCRAVAAAIAGELQPAGPELLV